MGNCVFQDYDHPQFPECEDFGDLTIIGGNGATGYHRVGWLTTLGLATWGDGRTVFLGTDGCIKMHKYLNASAERTGDHLFLVDHHGERHLEVAGTIGFPFFGQLIRDCLNETTTAMTQEHIFLAADLCLIMKKKRCVLGKRTRESIDQRSGFTLNDEPFDI